MSREPADALGAIPDGSGSCRFCVWAPDHESVEVHLVGQDRSESLDAAGLGYYRGVLDRAPAGTRYFFRLSGGSERPDPASRLQPEGVHGPSEVVDLAFQWSDTSWSGLPLPHYVIYELHVGTFTEEGTFEAVIRHLEHLRDLGITAIEIMPVAQFPGGRNWGYDGVYPFAVQTSYGGPRGLQRLVNACHRLGMAVILDVVYNHLGPEGNYLSDFGPYFTDSYRTPWGRAFNFDGPWSDGVRRYFIENAIQWIRDFHIDGLRLDAVHAIMDQSARPFLEELADRIRALGEELGRNVSLIAESDLNDPRLIRDPVVGGHGLDAMWSDDFHHAAHVLLTGERNGYYQDFHRVEDLGRAWRRGITYDGAYSVYRKRRHGRPIPGLEPRQIVTFTQNHDQVGNRRLGDRLNAVVDFESEKLAAGITALSPYLPLLFMGQEYGETAPFPYFVSHGEPALVEAVRRGRQEEFQSFGWDDAIPDPQSEQTYRSAILNHRLRGEGHHAALLDLYRQLFRLRRSIPAREVDDTVSMETQEALFVLRGERVWMVFYFGTTSQTLCLSPPVGTWRLAVDSADEQWHGPGSASPESFVSQGEVKIPVSPRSFAVYIMSDNEPSER